MNKDFNRSGGKPHKYDFDDATDPEALERFVWACQEGNVTEATRVAQGPGLTREQVTWGIANLMIYGRAYQGLDTLVPYSNLGTLEFAAKSFPEHVLNYTAVREEALQVAKFLTRNEIKCDSTAFMHPLILGDEKVCAELLEKGSYNAAEDHSISLMHAALMGNKKMFALLVKHGADPKEALLNAPQNDPRYLDGIKNLAEWGPQLYAEEMAQVARQKTDGAFRHTRRDGPKGF